MGKGESALRRGRVRWRGRRLGAAFALCLAVAAAGPGAFAQGGRESHHWIVLLDVSASFERREEAQNRPVGKPGYRLRNEALSLLQTLLAARRVKEQERRDDRLSVYVFGQGVERLQELSTQPVRWVDVNNPDWWQAQIPTGLGARTDYFEALRRAVEVFKDDLPGTARHLVLISDGELDVDPQNRDPGAPPEREEMAKYRELLRRDVAPLNWLYDHRVQIHALAVDEQLASFNEAARQEQIQRTLQRQPGAAHALERARGLLEVLAGRVRPNGKLAESEGPYVMAALAEAFGGSSRSVRYDNVLDVLWETLFPEYVSTRRLPLGTTQVIVFAPRQAPVPVMVEEEGEPRELSVLYDEESGSYRTEPPGPWRDLRVGLQTTTQYTTWLIEHPRLLEVDPLYRVAGEEGRFSIVPVTNVAFRWQEGRPPEQVLSDAPIPLTVDLVWIGDRPEPTRDDWRRYLESIRLPATGEVELPDATVRPVSLSPIVPGDASDVVLRLEGSFAPTMEGTHEARVSVRLGDHPDAAEMKADPVRFGVLDESPLSVPGLFLLHLRRWQGGKPAEAIPLPAAEAGREEPKTVWTDSDEVVPVVFEWWGKAEERCKGVERLRLLLPDFEEVFEPDENEIDPGERPREGDRLVCYRTRGIRVGPDRFGVPARVGAEDGLVKERWWCWQVRRTTPRWVGCAWIGLPLLLLAGLLTAYLNRRRLRRWWGLRPAPFPLALELSGRSLAWREGRPKRFVVTLDRRGKPEAELSRRTPPAGAPALVIEQESRHTCRVRVASGPAWTVQRFNPEGRAQGGPRPLTGGGESVTLVDLARGHRVHLAQGEARVTLRHRSR